MADSVEPEVGVPWVDLEEEKGRFEGMGEEEVRKFWEKWGELERMREEEPWRWGWRLGMWMEVVKRWKEYGVHVVLGGNRSSKSTMAARVMVSLAEQIPEAQLECWHVDERRSVDDQQKFVWEALAKRYRDGSMKKRGPAMNLQYTQQNGFVGGKVILPPKEGRERGSVIYFRNYNQWKQNGQVAEGYWRHGIWCDEEVPEELFGTLLLRLSDARGRMLVTFTTLRGWSSLVGRLLGRVRVLRKRWAGLVRRELPVLRESVSQPDCMVYNFWTEDNVFVVEDGWRKKLEGRPMSEVMARAYGEPVKSAVTVFPKFREEVNVMKRHEDLPWLREGGVGEGYRRTCYQGIDGAGARNWFMLWVAVDEGGVWWVYDEWPRVDELGEWAEGGSEAGGVKGPAQQSLGYGFNDYVKLVREREGKHGEGSEVFERYLDPRFAATERQVESGVSTPQQELAARGLYCRSAPGVNEDAGLQEINTLLEWDETKQRDILTNSPRLFISPRCGNLIFAMKEYTASRGKDEPTKDPVDVLRYLAVAKIGYLNVKAGPQSVGGGGGY